MLEFHFQIFLTLVGQYFPRAEDLSELVGGGRVDDGPGRLLAKLSPPGPILTRPPTGHPATPGKPDTYLLDTFYFQLGSFLDTSLLPAG